MALGLKVLIFLFGILAFAVALYFTPPNFMDTVRCLFSPAGCSPGGMGFLGTNMMVPGMETVGFN